MNLGDRPGVVGGPSDQKHLEHRRVNMHRSIIFAIPALVVLILALCFWQGMVANDDLGYAEIAESWIRSGQAVPAWAGHHGGRLGLTGPLALIFIFFGVTNWSLAVLPLICTMATASLIAMIAYRLFGLSVAIVSGCVYAVLPLTIILATVYVPEPIATLEMTLASYLFLLAIIKENTKANCLYFVAGLLVGMAYLTTETGSLMIVVFVIYAGLSRLVRPRLLWILVGFSVVLGSELFYYNFATGDFFYRFTLGARYAYDPVVQGANTNLPYRLLKAYPNMFIRPNLAFGLFGPLLIAAGVYGLVQLRNCSFLLIWSAVIVAFYNFMSASMSHYVALPADARLIYPACVPIVVLAGKCITDCWQWTSRTINTALLLLGRLLMITGLIMGLVVSLVSLYLVSSTSLTVAIARNAATVARFLDKIPSVVLMSDKRSVAAIRFYRQFNQMDYFFDFETVPDAISTHLYPADKPVFVVVNGPIVYERETTGATYGYNLTLKDRNRLRKFMSQDVEPVFSAYLEQPFMFDLLLGYRWVRALMGARDYHFAQSVFNREANWGSVEVFVDHAGGSALTSNTDVQVRHPLQGKTR